MRALASPVRRSFLSTITNPRSVITAMPSGFWFPESLEIAKQKYREDIVFFVRLVRKADSADVEAPGPAPA